MEGWEEEGGVEGYGGSGGGRGGVEGRREGWSDGGREEAQETRAPVQTTFVDLQREILVFTSSRKCVGNAVQNAWKHHITLRKNSLRNTQAKECVRWTKRGGAGMQTGHSLLLASSGVRG